MEVYCSTGQSPHWAVVPVEEEEEEEEYILSKCVEFKLFGNDSKQRKLFSRRN
jgi:hypothetical protein